MLEMNDRIRLLEDLAEIKRLKAEYCHLADIWKDVANRGEKFANLFATEGRWVFMGTTFVGAAAIAEELMRLPQAWNIDKGLHLALNPRIDVVGDSAVGTWHFLIPVISRGSKEPAWSVGMYFEKYIRTPAGWRFLEVIVETAIAPGN
jgi:SnoaL-like domain